MNTTTTKKYKTIISEDLSPERPSDMGNDVRFIVNEGNRYFGGLYEKGLPAPDSDQWLIIKPLFGYVHGGQQISLQPFSCPWDSGMIGYVGILKGDYESDNPEKLLTSLVKEWQDYFTGDCYMVKLQELTITHNGGDISVDDWQTIEVNGNIYGKDQAEEQAKELIEVYQK
jgi:hypothetical protein